MSGRTEQYTVLLDVHVTKSTGQATKLVARTNEFGIRRQLMKLSGARTPDSDGHVVFLPLEPMLAYDIAGIAGEGFVMTEAAENWVGQFEDHLSSALQAEDIDEVDFTHVSGLENRKYQQVAAYWAYTVGRGILGDPTGTGKTVEALLLAERVIRDNPSAKILIVAPRYVHRDKWVEMIRFNFRRPCVWPAEMQRASDRANVLEMARQSHGTFVVINYDMLLPKFSDSYRLLYDTVWDLIIFDEGHYLQGRNSGRTKGSKRLRGERKILSTATPVWNNPDSLWSILNLLYPQRFSSYWRWVEQFCVSEETPWGPKIIGPKDSERERLQWILTPMLLRREKSELLPELPELILKTLEFELNSQHLTLYKKVRKEMKRMGVVDLSALRMLVNAPRLLIEKGHWIADQFDCDIPSSKDQELVRLIQNLYPEPVVVFTHHKLYAEHLSSIFNSQTEYACMFVHSDIPHGKRDDRVKVFREEPEGSLLVGTIGTIGTGIDLYEGSHGVFAEYGWLPLDQEQAVGRLHRDGQKTSPVIWQPFVWDTIDQYVFETQLMKSDDHAAIMDMLMTKEKAKEIVMQRIRDGK